MITTNSHQFVLEEYRGPRSRHTCPSCKKPRELTRYIDTKTGQHVAPHVGMCNRLNKCGYHYPPADYFRDNPQLNEADNWKESEAHKTAYTKPEHTPPPVDYIPRELAIESLTAFDKNNFLRYLVKLFGEDKARQLAERYKLGTSKHWRNAGGYAVIFWQIDRAENTRQAKVMPYDPETGKRIKKPDGLEIFRNGKYQPQPEDRKPGAYFAGKRLLKNKDANLVQCFFGEHLLSAAPSAPVAIVESEKTAVIMAGINPKPIWIATGGANGARWTSREVFKVLEGRTVVLYPDLGMTEEWEEKAKILNTVCRASVSRLLEDKAPEKDRRESYDIADYFIKQITRTDAVPTPQEAPQESTPPPVAAQRKEAEPQPAPKAERRTEPENKPQGSKEMTGEHLKRELVRLTKAFSGIKVRVTPLELWDLYIHNPRQFVDTSLKQLAKKDISSIYAKAIIERLNSILLWHGVDEPPWD